MKSNPAPILLLAAAASLLFSGCSSDSSSTGGSSTAGAGLVGGPVPGDDDAHCNGRTPIIVDPAACHSQEADSGAGGAPSENAASDGGGNACDLEHDAQYGETLFNREGDDDDCKYQAAWISTPILLNADVTFTVTTKNLTTGKPLEALADGDLPLSRLEVYQPCKPTRLAPAQDYHAQFEATAPGVYTGGPIRFDQSGRWVVRFHFYEQCVDGESSPHGHIAFFVDVP